MCFAWTLEMFCDLWRRICCFWKQKCMVKHRSLLVENIPPNTHVPISETCLGASACLSCPLVVLPQTAGEAVGRGRGLQLCEQPRRVNRTPNFEDARNPRQVLVRRPDFNSATSHGVSIACSLEVPDANLQSGASGLSDSNCIRSYGNVL